jgi:hypothetical protein
MPALPHDPDTPSPRVRPAAAEAPEAPRGAATVDAAHGIAVAQRWLVDELRDECSDIGVSARGLDLDAFTEGVAVFAREAQRLGALPERMLVLLKECLADDAIPRADRDRYQLYVDVAVTAAVRAYFANAAGRAG